MPLLNKVIFRTSTTDAPTADVRGGPHPGPQLPYLWNQHGLELAASDPATPVAAVGLMRLPRLWKECVHYLSEPESHTCF